MVDNTNPTNQFHPYTPADATPHSQEPPGGLRGILGRFGIDTSSLGTVSDRLRGVDVQRSVGKVRDFARSNPGLALGGLAAAAIGAGLLRRR